jgi:hypothetical protein
MMNGPKFLIETQPACNDPLVIEAGDCPARPGVPLTASPASALDEEDIMYRTLRSSTGMGTLVLGSLLGVGTSPVQAQDYAAPAPRYAAPAPHYAAPAPPYTAPAYTAPAPRYAAPAPRYAAPTYAAPADTSAAQRNYNFYMQALFGG